MKNLLKHLQTELREELEEESGPEYSNMNSRLHYIYEDLLDKTESALAELDESSVGTIGVQDSSTYHGFETNGYHEDLNVPEDVPDAFEGTREDFAEFAENFKDVTGRDISDQLESSKELFSGEKEQANAAPEPGTERTLFSEDSSVSPKPETSENTEFDKNEWDDPFQEDEHHAMRDGSKETFEDLKERVENLTGSPLDTERFQEIGGIIEKAKNSDSISMQSDDFQRLLSQLRPSLVDWATGKRDVVESFDTNEMVNEIQSALHRAQKETDGNVDLLESFEKYVSDTIFYASPESGNREENVHSNDVRDPRKP